jgi:hypothetical protein
MVALSFGDDQLARRLIALAPNDPDLAFHAGVVTLSTGAWKEAAVLFGKSNVPEAEKRITETAIALAPIVDAGRPADGTSADPAQLEALIQATSDSPRGLILIAQVATMLGLDKVSERALQRSVEAVPAVCHLATRLMIANYAERAASPAVTCFAFSPSSSSRRIALSAQMVRTALVRRVWQSGGSPRPGFYRAQNIPRSTKCTSFTLLQPSVARACGPNCKRYSIGLRSILMRIYLSVAMAWSNLVLILSLKRKFPFPSRLNEWPS